jgi:hypothetical protein
MFRVLLSKGQEVVEKTRLVPQHLGSKNNKGFDKMVKLLKKKPRAFVGAAKRCS